MLKKLLFFSACIMFFTYHSFAQWQWSVRGGSVNNMQTNRDYNNINHIASDQAGNVYILGQIGGAGVKVANQPLNAYSGIYPGASLDIVLSSFTSNGTYRWSKVIGGEVGDYAYSLQVDNHGHVYVSGRIRNVNTTLIGTPYAPVHFDTDTILPKIPIDSVTTSTIKDTLNQTLFLVQYDTSGTFNWLRMPEPDTTSIYRMNFPVGMDADPNGDVYWFCYLKPGEYRGAGNIITQEGTYVLKFNSQGSVVGVTQLELNVGRGVDLVGIVGGITHFGRNPLNGNYFIAGTNSAKQYTFLSIGGDTITSNMYISCFSPSGQLLWKKESGGVDLGSIEDIELDANGNIYIGGLVKPGTELGGHTFSSPKSSGAPFVSAFDASGNHLWSEMAVVDAVSIVYDVAISDTEVAVTGYGSSLYWPSNTDSVKTLGNQGYDAFLARFNKINGELITMERTNTPFGGASYGNAIAAGPQNTYYLGGNFDQAMYLGQDTLYKVGSQRSFFLTKYECDVPEASMSVSGINATNTINLIYTGDPADSVKWYLGDGTQVWGDSIQHSYATKGKYRVCAMAYFECTEVTVCDSLVAGEINLEEQSLAEVAIYPNPTNSLLYLENLPKHSSVKLYNLNGKLLLQEAFKEQKASLDLSQLSKGVYLLELQNKTGESDFRKIVKE